MARGDVLLVELPSTEGREQGGRPSVVMVFQMRAVDKARIIRTLLFLGVIFTAAS